MTFTKKISPRREHLQQQHERALASPSLAERFPNLKALSLQLGHYDSGGVLRNSQVKYTANVLNAKSFFRIGCHNPECVRGDFDLSQALAEAVDARHTTASGELRCQGWQSKTTVDAIPCGKILRYTLTLGY